jgi:hypothetical protein
VHLGSVHSIASACSAKWPSLLGISAQPTRHFGPAEEAGEGNSSPDAGGSPAEFGRPAVVGRRGNSLGVAPGDGVFDLRRRAAGGSPWRLLDGGGRSAEGDRRGGDGRRSLAAGCWGGKVSGARGDAWGGAAVAGGGPVRADVAEALGGSGAAPVASLRRLCFDDKVVGLGLEGGGGARGATARGGAVVWLSRRQLSSRAWRAEG